MTYTIVVDTDYSRKPLKSKRLKIINHKGTLYATFDGTRVWKLDDIAFSILKMCDGKRTYEQIVNESADKANLDKESVRRAVALVFEELTRLNFVEWLD